MRILALLLAAVCARAETLDRIAVTVGRHVISERDILQDMRVAAFIDGKTPDFGAEQKRKAAERLVDQYLVLEDATATRVPPPPAADVAGSPRFGRTGGAGGRVARIRCGGRVRHE